MAEVGETLADRYRLEAEIGAGGHATVWRATDLLLDRTVAIKVLGTELEGTSSKDRFIREAQAAAGLRHPNIVTVFDLGDDDDRPYMVLEYVDGPSLADVLEGHGALAPEEVVRIGRAVALALGEAHEAGLVHRDVKPGNVLLSRDGNVKVADFGIVKALGAADQTLTETGIVVGTVTYLAPEQLEGDDIGPPTDVYALGLVLHECLTGRPAFGGGTSTEVALARLSQEPARPGEERDDVPPALDDAIAQALSKDPAARFNGGRAFAQALTAAPSEAAAGAIARLASAVPGPDEDTDRAEERVADRDDGDEVDRAAEQASQNAAAPEGGPEEGAATVAMSRSEPVEDRRSNDTEEHAATRPVADEEPGDDDRPVAGRPPIVAISLVALIALLGVLAVVVGGDDSDETPTEEPLGIAAAEAFDPFGDGEHPDRAPNAYDGDPGTTWTTQRYNAPDLGGLKPGVGIWFDLEDVAEIQTVEIDLVSGGADLELYAFDSEPSGDTDEWGDPVAHGDDVAAEVRLDVDGTEGRYWLVWFTSLPPDGGRYRAEVADVRFVGR